MITEIEAETKICKDSELRLWKGITLKNTKDPDMTGIRRTWRRAIMGEEIVPEEEELPKKKLFSINAMQETSSSPASKDQ